MLREKINTSKTPKEKAKLATEKSRWRKKCQQHYGDSWSKKTASRLKNGKRKMNP